MLPHQKNDSLGSGNEVLLLSEPGPPDMDPLLYFSTYISARDARFPYRPELWLSIDGAIPTRRWFISRLRKFFPDNTISGHSLRAGGATALAAAGMAPDLIRASGRWSSDEFNKYIRTHPFLLHAIIQGTGHS
jgi:hypothetical protein